MPTPNSLPKNRHANAPKNADYTINKDWESYTLAEHVRWNRLIDRQRNLLPGRACGELLSALGEDISLLRIFYTGGLFMFCPVHSISESSSRTPSPTSAPRVIASARLVKSQPVREASRFGSCRRLRRPCGVAAFQKKTLRKSGGATCCVLWQRPKRHEPSKSPRPAPRTDCAR